MKKLLGFLFNTWVLAFLGLLALALLIWFAGPLIGFADARPLERASTRLILIVVLGLTYLAHRAWKRWRAHCANKAVVGQLLADMPATAKRDAADGELAIIDERFKTALAKLAKVRFAHERGLWAGISARFDRRYLYELPWYLIIGAPGSGKTTALLNAGLDFPLASSLGDNAIRGVGGTRHCDWWFTDQAVLIDTAGRYTTQDSNRAVDAKAWTGFLGMLKSNRPRRPLNGVLVTVSVENLLTRNAAARAEYALLVRARVQELHASLGIRFPVYLLVTKCDLLAGFMDYLGDCSKEMRQDPWGFTFELDSQQHTDLGVMPQEFDLLHQRLIDGLIDRLQSERDPARRARIYGFPEQFAGLREVLKEFVGKVFQPSEFEERPLLRGVYFISGTQEGTPIDRMLGTIARTYRLARTPGPANQATGKSFFLSRLLREVVFGEAELAGTNLKWERRRGWLVVGGYVAIGVLFVIATAAWTVSYLNNRRYIAAVGAEVNHVRQLMPAEVAQPSTDMLALLPGLAAIKTLAIKEQGSVPWSLGFGLYQGYKLDAAARQVYDRMLVETLLPRISLRVEEQLRSSFDNPVLQYEALKAYRMLQDPQHFDAHALKLYVMADWDANLPRETRPEQREALESHLDALLQLGSAMSALPEDKQLVTEVRAALTKVSAAERIYNRIRREGTGSDLPEFTVANAAGAAAGQVFTRASGNPITRGISGLYTVDGYYKAFQSGVDATTRQLQAEETWVLGLPEDHHTTAVDEQARHQLAEDVRRLYLNDYAKQWEAYIADIHLLPINNLAQAVQMARILSAPDNPLLPLMRGLSFQTTLISSPSKSLIETAADKATTTFARSREQLARLLADKNTPAAPSPAQRIENLVDSRFDALRSYVNAAGSASTAPIDSTIGLINEVYTFLTAADNAVKAGNAPPTSDVVNKATAEAARLPQPMRGLLNSLVSSGNGAIVQGSRTNLSKAVNSNIGEFCRRAVQGRYPFVRSSSIDVTQDDFSRLFAPGGLIDDFFQKNLVSLVDTSTRPWSFRRLGDAPISKDHDALLQFQRAAVIRDTFFHAGGTAAGLRFEFEPESMDASITMFTLDFDGQIVKYAHGPSIPTAIQWPSPKGGAQVRLSLQPPLAGGTSGQVTNGPWALFRMLDNQQFTPGSRPERFKVTFNVDNRKATFELTANSVLNPFRLRELAEFSCPGSI